MSGEQLEHDHLQVVSGLMSCTSLKLEEEKLINIKKTFDYSENCPKPPWDQLL
jgi:hypothetical protein